MNPIHQPTLKHPRSPAAHWRSSTAPNAVHKLPQARRGQLAEEHLRNPPRHHHRGHMLALRLREAGNAGEGNCLLIRIGQGISRPSTSVTPCLTL